VPFAVDGVALDVIQAPKWSLESCGRYGLSDYEWSVIKPMLPNKSRGIARVHDRRILNGIFWLLRSCAPWRDLPESYGPHTTCYNRFVRWRQGWRLGQDHGWAGRSLRYVGADDRYVSRAGAPARGLHRGHQRATYWSFAWRTSSKIHAVVDTNGLPVKLGLTPGEAHDNRLCSVLLTGLHPRTMLLADRGYDADWIRLLASQQGAWANIPSKRNRKEPICFSPFLYRARNLVERFFNKIKQCRRIATHYDNARSKLLAFIKLASIRIWLRANESTP
jgi:transposase